MKKAPDPGIEPDFPGLVVPPGIEPGFSLAVTKSALPLRHGIDGNATNYTNQEVTSCMSQFFK